MLFKRSWDSTCPRVYDSWQTDDVTWLIQDLLPEDDEEAIKLLEDNMCPDETLSALSGLVNDPESMRNICDFWRKFLRHRMSLACYTEVDGERELVGLNVCYVAYANDEHDVKVEGQCLLNFLNAFGYIAKKVDTFKYLGLDKVLSAVGLVVKRKCRGAKLGARILAAREPLASPLGIKGTSTIFTGEAAQKCAARCGFTTVLTVSIKELAASGLRYPTDDERVIKVMVKKFD